MSGDPRSAFYKGWARPGPRPPARAEFLPDLEIPAGETLDALSGWYRIFQLKDGHRFSTDDLLVAWFGTMCCPSAGRVLELGSGIGTVGMIAAWRLPGARFVTVEAQSESVRLARKSWKLNGLEDRVTILEGDFREVAAQGEFDLVLGSPPYFPLDSGITSEHPQKVACRFEVRGSITDYCQIAARHLAPGGIFACVFPVNPPHQRERVARAARESGLTVIRRRDVVLKEGEPPLLGLFAMMRAEHLPEWMRGQTWEDAPLIIRRLDGSIHPEYSVVKLSIGFPP